MTLTIHREISVYYNKRMVEDDVTLLSVSLVIALLNNDAYCSVTKLSLLRRYKCLEFCKLLALTL